MSINVNLTLNLLKKIKKYTLETFLYKFIYKNILKHLRYYIFFNFHFFIKQNINIIYEFFLYGALGDTDIILQRFILFYLKIL